MRTSVFILMLVGVGWTQFLPAQDPCPCREVWGSLWTPESGIFFEAGYYGEVFTNARGGISSKGATQYFGLLDLFLTCDFERLRSPVPGKFVMLAQNTHGRGIAADFTGATQLLSDIDSSSNIAQVSEYWWEVEMLDGALTLRLGKQDLNDHFVYIDAAARRHASRGVVRRGLIPVGRNGVGRAIWR